MSTSAAVLEVRRVSQRHDGTPRILITRLSAVGDCVQTLPLAAALRRHFPQAHIAWAVEKGAADLLQVCPDIDDLIVLPRGFAKSPRVLWELCSVLRRQRFDLAVDPQGLTKSSLVALLSGAKRRVGFARPVARELSPWLQTEHIDSRRSHRVERYLELLRPLGIDDATVEFHLSLPAAALSTAHDLLRSPGPNSRYVVLNPGAGWDSKRWPTERYAAIATHLAARGVRSLVTWGGKRELSLAEQIVAGSQGVAELAPPTTLLELAAVLQQALLVVGSDTGPIHLAAALGTPCVALFGSSLASDCGPFGGQHTRLQAAHDESPGRKRPGADNWALREISVAMVCDASDEQLSRRQRGVAA